MRTLRRNKQKFYYSTFVELEELTEPNGSGGILFTGQFRPVYTEPVMMFANISPAQGASQIEQFGSSLQYDRVIVIDDPKCPIDENTVLFVDKEPERDWDGNLLFDYIVRKVARSINSVSIAISKVKIS